MDAYPDPANAPDPTEAVAERIAEMPYATLRDRCDTFRSWRRYRPTAERFGAWLRDQVSSELAAEARASFDP